MGCTRYGKTLGVESVIPRVGVGWPRTKLAMYPRINDGGNVSSGGEWDCACTNNLLVNEPTYIHIYNIFINTEM